MKTSLSCRNLCLGCVAVLLGSVVGWAQLTPQSIEAAAYTGGCQSNYCYIFEVTDCASWFSVNCCPNALHWCSNDPRGLANKVCDPSGGRTYCAGTDPACGMYGDWGCK